MDQNKVTKGFEPLPRHTEWLLSQIVDAGLRVHKTIGVGFFEKIYRNAMCVELGSRTIPFEKEKPFAIGYRSQHIGIQRIDLVVDSGVIVEIKAVDKLIKVHDQQILAYLRATKIRAGLLMNFGAPLLSQGLKRFVI